MPPNPYFENAMKAVAVLTMLAVSFSLAAAQIPPKEIGLLKAQWQEARNKVTRPLDEKYKAELEKLLTQKTKDGLLEEALAVKEELEALGDPQANEDAREVESRIVGTIWERDSGSHVMSFMEDGKFSSEDRWKSNNNISHGRWVVTGARTIQCMNARYPGIITEITFNPGFTRFEGRNLEDPNVPVSDADRRFLGTSYMAAKK
jgi:hypothetical protein